MNDIIPWDDFATDSEDCSGYNPFFKLLARQDIDEKWKKHATNDMHAIIGAEITGKKPRVWHEDALRSYVKKLGNLLKGGNLPYSKDLLAYQILFIIEADYRRIVSWWFAERVFALLDGDDYKYHRLRLAKHVFLTNDEHVYIYNEKTVGFLRRVLDEFSNNEELAGALTDLLGEQVAGMARRN